MSLLTMNKDEYNDSTVISNRFIDDYMKDANDAEIKVYLYLVRMMSANLPTSVSDIADKFNHTEREVMRALKYWEKCNLLSLEFNESKVLTGIRFRSPANQTYVETEHTPAQIVPIKIVQDKENSIIIESQEEVTYEKPVKKYENVTPSYSRDQLKAFKNNPETAQLLFIAEAYLNRPLSQTDIQSLYFIHDELEFSCELTDALLQYCIEHGSTDFRYIRKVAIGWKEQEINTVEDLKERGSSMYEKYVYTILKSLGRNSQPVKQEADYAIRWHKEFGFSLDIISEACNRTVKATDSHRLEYCDKILSSWKKAGVTVLSDVSNCDASFKKDRTKPVANNSFNSFAKTDYDFDALEKILTNQ